VTRAISPPVPDTRPLFYGHPFSALFTAVMISLTVISPSALASPATQSVNGAVLSAMFTMVMSSFTVASPLLSQSPAHPAGEEQVVAVLSPMGTVCGFPFRSFLAFKWLTLASDFLGFHDDKRDGINDDVLQSAVGFKINPIGDAVIGATFQFPLNRDGLRADVIYTGQIEYAF